MIKKLNTLIEHYLEVAPHSKGWTRLEQRLHWWMKQPLSRGRLDMIEPIDFIEFRDSRLKKVKPATVDADLSAINTVYRYAIQEMQMKISNPLDQVKRPKVQNERKRRLEKDEEEKLLAAASPKFKAVLILAIETGMRRSEISRITWDGVDLEGRTITIFNVKNGDDERQVPLSSRAKLSLASLSGGKTGRVFYFSPERITAKFSALCKKVGITGLTFHDLRREAVTRWVETGNFDNVLEIAAMSGHKSINVLHNRYYRPDVGSLAAKLG